MKEVEREAYKRIPLEILKDVSAFCEEHQIRYSMAYGTLLGAVRHKGYIPWDDDIDIFMPRDDYERFRISYKSDNYILADFKNGGGEYGVYGVSKVFDKRTFYYFGKIRRKLGLFIDIFVIDKVPTDTEERQKWLRKVNRLQTWNIAHYTSFENMFYAYKGKSLIKKILIKLIPLTPSYVHKHMEALSIKYKNSNNVFVGCAIESRDYAYPKDYFEEFIDLEFEGCKFKSIKKYDEVLKILYGDYMMLPPEEDRIPKHHLVAYYK